MIDLPRTSCTIQNGEKKHRFNLHNFIESNASKAYSIGM